MTEAGDRGGRLESRRGFLARLAALGGAALAAIVAGRRGGRSGERPPRRPAPEREAEFWRPHGLAG